MFSFVGAPGVILFLIYSYVGFLRAETVNADGGDIKKHTITFNLIRQKTPFEQYLNFGHKMGDLAEDLFKKGGIRDNDSIALFRWLDNEFYGKIVVGHPGQSLDVNFDTTWSLSWLMSYQCTSIHAIGCWFHDKYDHSKSSEYKKDGRPYSQKLGNYTFSGFYSYDNISIAHSNVTNQSFVEIVTAPWTFMLNKGDGVLGLGLKTDDYNPFFYNLLNQKKIKNPVFSIYLNRDRQSNRGGNIMLGFVDDRHVHKSVINNKTVPDPITYLSVVDNTPYWQFKMDKIFIDIPKEDGVVLCQKGCVALVDSNANTIYGPKEDVDQIHDVIKAREFFLGRYTVDCDTVNKLPKIDFMLGGANFTLAGPEYTVKLSYYSITVCLSAFAPAQTAEEQGRWVLGGAFLAEYYSIYNVQERTLGFVKAA